jgi:predicted amidophosphoribosyltransferase
MSATVVRCNGCGKEISSELASCPNCGRKRKGAPRLFPCPDCGHQVSQSAVACPGCGRRIAFATAIFSAIFWAGVVLAVFGVIVVALLQIASMRP